MNKKECRMYDLIVEMDIATTQEINLVRNLLDGSWEEILNAIVYARTGYNTLEQFIAETYDDFEWQGVYIMDDKQRDIILKTLYWGMWVSADFEELFRRDWFTVYQNLKEGNEELVPDNVLAMIRIWLSEDDDEEEEGE